MNSPVNAAGTAAVTSRPPILFVDVGSTVVKMCTHDGTRGFGSVHTIPRCRDIAPGEQVRALVDEWRRRENIAGLRVCSSANGGIRVGVAGLSRRHSMAAAARAVVAAGGNVVYQRALGGPASDPPPSVDLVVLVGGVTGGDPRHLREALAQTQLAQYPRRRLVWAGAEAPDIVAALPVDYVAENVIGDHLRPQLSGLTEVIRRCYMCDLVDHKGLAALAAITDTPIWPTPAAVGLAAQRIAAKHPAIRPLPVAPAAPLVIVDVGGATTDVLYCAELSADNGAAASTGESILRQVFTDLGVAVSLPALLGQLGEDTGLGELVAAVAPGRSRALFHGICDGAPEWLAPPVGFLACLYLALRRLSEPSGPHRVNLARAISFVVTGGAWMGAPTSAIRRVITAACGMPDTHWTLMLDHPYLLWAHGLMSVPTHA
jgi:hypothetical protein